MKRLTLVLLIVALAAVVTNVAFAQDRPDRPNRDTKGVFWNPSQADYDRWRVIEGVEEGATIRFWTWALTPDFEDYLNQVIKNFEATYPGRQSDHGRSACRWRAR